MQEVAKRPLPTQGEVTRRVPAVAFVPGNGVSCGGEVDTNLVLPSCQWGAAKEGAVVVGFEDIDLGAGFLERLVFEG